MIQTAPANTSDDKLILPVVEDFPEIGGKPGRPSKHPDVIYAARGYDSEAIRQSLRSQGIRLVIARRGLDHGSSLEKIRWVVERTISWFKGCDASGFATTAPTACRTHGTGSPIQSSATALRSAGASAPDSFCQGLLTSGDMRPWMRRRHQPIAELMPLRNIVLGMYLQEDVVESLPSSICITRKRLVESGTWMPQQTGFVSVVDTHWAILLAALGNRLVINEALVAKRQDRDIITGRISDDALDREFAAIRELQYRALPADLNPPPLNLALQILASRRAAHRLLVRRRPLEAAALAARAWNPRAWLMAVKAALARRFPALVTGSRRTRILGAPSSDLIGNTDSLQPTEVRRASS